MNACEHAGEALLLLHLKRIRPLDCHTAAAAPSLTGSPLPLVHQVAAPIPRPSFNGPSPSTRAPQTVEVVACDLDSPFACRQRTGVRSCAARTASCCRRSYARRQRRRHTPAPISSHQAHSAAPPVLPASLPAPSTPDSVYPLAPLRTPAHLPRAQLRRRRPPALRQPLLWPRPHGGVAVHGVERHQHRGAAGHRVAPAAQRLVLRMGDHSGGGRCLTGSTALRQQRR